MDRSQIPCYWENQPTGCSKPHCAFKHFKPKPDVLMASVFPKPEAVPVLVNQPAAALATAPAPSKLPALAIPKVSASLAAELEEGRHSGSNSPGHASPVVTPVIINIMEQDSDHEMLASPVKSGVLFSGSPKKQQVPVLREVERSSVAIPPRKPAAVSLQSSSRGDAVVMSLEEIHRQRALDSMKKVREAPETPDDADFGISAHNDYMDVRRVVVDTQEPEKPKLGIQERLGQKRPVIIEEIERPAIIERPAVKSRLGVKAPITDRLSGKMPIMSRLQLNKQDQESDQLEDDSTSIRIRREQPDHRFNQKEPVTSRLNKKVSIKSRLHLKQQEPDSDMEDEAVDIKINRVQSDSQLDRKVPVASRLNKKVPIKSRLQLKQQEPDSDDIDDNTEDDAEDDVEHDMEDDMEDEAVAIKINRVLSGKKASVTSHPNKKYSIKSRLQLKKEEGEVDSDDEPEPITIQIKREPGLARLDKKEPVTIRRPKKVTEPEKPDLASEKGLKWIKILKGRGEATEKKRRKITLIEDTTDRTEEKPSIQPLSLDVIRKRKALKARQVADYDDLDSAESERSDTEVNVKILSLEEIRRRKALKEQKDSCDQDSEPDEKEKEVPEKRSAEIMSLAEMRRRKAEKVAQMWRAQPDKQPVGVKAKDDSSADRPVLSLEEIRRRKFQRLGGEQTKGTAGEDEAEVTTSLRNKEKPLVVKKPRVERQIYMPPAMKNTVASVPTLIIQTNKRVLAPEKDVPPKKVISPSKITKLPPKAKENQQTGPVEVKTFSEIMAEKRRLRLEKQQQQQRTSEEDGGENGSQDAVSRPKFCFQPVAFDSAAADKKASTSPVKTNSRVSNTASEDVTDGITQPSRMGNKSGTELSTSPVRARLNFQNKVQDSAKVDRFGDQKAADIGSVQKPNAENFGKSTVMGDIMQSKPFVTKSRSGVSQEIQSVSSVSRPSEQKKVPVLPSSVQSSKSEVSMPASVTDSLLSSSSSSSSSSLAAESLSDSSFTPTIVHSRVAAAPVSSTPLVKPVTSSQQSPQRPDSVLNPHVNAATGTVHHTGSSMYAGVNVAAEQKSPPASDSTMKTLTTNIGMKTPVFPAPTFKRQSSGGKTQSVSKQRQSQQGSSSDKVHRFLSENGDDLLLDDDDITLDDGGQLDDLLLDIDSLLE